MSIWPPRPHPTLLRVPAWCSNHIKDEIVLLLAPEAYDVAPGEGINGRWIVTRSSGAVVYDGIHWTRRRDSLARRLLIGGLMPISAHLIDAPARTPADNASIA